MEPILLKELLLGLAHTGLEEVVTSVITDSRKVQPGGVFVAIKGERSDGHAFAKTALEQGAVAVVAEHEIEGLPKERVFVVPSALDAMIQMGGNYRAGFSPVVLGITGSVGKTTTKEFCAAVFSAFGNTLKTEGNQNNEIGVPNTLFRLSPAVEYAVVEMGMDHMGDLHKLSLATKPAAAIITRIGVSHIEHLGSQENILKAKMQICDGLQPGGLLCVNGDDERLAGTQPPKGIKKIMFGIENAAAPVRACDIIDGAFGERFTICDDVHGSFAVQIPAVGRHNIYNALAAYTLATRIGLAAAQVVTALGNYQTTGMRQRVVECDGMQLIEDCYNANPDSMRAALEALATLGKAGRRVAVLGDMLELGDISASAHREVGALAAASGVHCLVTFGPGGAQIAQGAAEAGLAEVHHCETKAQAAGLLRNYCRAGDTVLFKASRGMAFEEIEQAFCKGEI